MTENNKVQCPLCDGDMMLNVLPSAPNGREDKTYMWVCEDCPGVLLEWYDSKDTDAFVKETGSW